MTALEEEVLIQPRRAMALFRIEIALKFKLGMWRSQPMSTSKINSSLWMLRP